MIPTLKDEDFTWFKVQVAAWWLVYILPLWIPACIPVK